MVAGICGGLDPDVPVGTLDQPGVRGGALDRPQLPPLPAGRHAHLRQAGHHRRRHPGPGAEPALLRGGIASPWTWRRRPSPKYAKEVGCAWSAYRCIGDRIFDGFLDDRVLAMTNPDGSGNPEKMRRLIAEDPQLAANLERLAEDTSNAARLAAEAAVRGCRALDEAGV